MLQDAVSTGGAPRTDCGQYVYRFMNGYKETMGIDATPSRMLGPEGSAPAPAPAQHTEQKAPRTCMC